VWPVSLSSACLEGRPRPNHSRILTKRKHDRSPLWCLFAPAAAAPAPGGPMECSPGPHGLVFTGCAYLWDLPGVFDERAIVDLRSGARRMERRLVLRACRGVVARTRARRVHAHADRAG